MHGWRDLALLCYGVIYLKNKVYLFTSGYFTLQRSQSQHTAHNTDELWPCLWYEKWSAMIGHFHWGNDDFKKKQQNNEGTLQEQFLNQLESNSGIILLVFSLCRWCFGSLMELSMAREWKSHFLRERMRNSHEHGVRKDPMQKKKTPKKQTNKQKSPVEPARATAAAVLTARVRVTCL